MQHNFNHEIHCATEAHRRGNKPACRHHLLMAIESLDAPQHQFLRDLPIGTKVQTTDAQVWQVIKHEPEYRLVKLKLLTSENHQEWDAPEDMRVEWRVTGCCEIWTIVEGSHRGKRKHCWCVEVEDDPIGYRHYKPDSTYCSKCGYRVGKMPGFAEWLKICESPCNPEPRPFTFSDALAIMERGGECESRFAEHGLNAWTICRIHDSKRQAKGTDGTWREDWACYSWERMQWRPYNPEANHE